MRPVVFVTANQGKHREVTRLLAGLDVRSARLDLARAPSDDLQVIARARAAEAYRRLGEACFVESTGLWLWEHDGAPGASFKRAWRDLGEEGFAQKYGGAHGVSRVVVALAEAADPADVRLFEGSIAGCLLVAPRGEGGYGWDRLWVPDGYDRTLGEMAESTYVVNMRAAPYLELGDHLRGRTTPATFEAHVTVALAGAADLAAFRDSCAALGVKCIVIELPEGDTPVQPMTASFHRGELLAVQEEVVAIARALVKKGFAVTRTKIEAHGRLLGAPETDADAAQAPTTSYFEFHAKLALPETADLATLAALCKAHGAHLSRNAHKLVGADGLSERFVTLRAHAVGRINAEAGFVALCAAIAAAGHLVRNRIREYTVFDTNVGLDRGWLSS